MKGKRIFDAITDVSGELIEEARTTKLKRMRKSWKVWVTVAACFVLVLSLGIGKLPTFWHEGVSSPGPIIDVIYPKAFAFDDSETMRKIRDQNPVDESFIEALNEFAYRTSAEIFEGKGENINYSPVSLYYALALATSGAEGETQRELLELLGVNDEQTLSKHSGNLYRLLHSDNEIGKLKIANSIWMDDDMNGRPIEFKENFVKNAVENYYASSHSVDFGDKSTAEAMAKWVSDNTNGTIEPSFQFDRDQIMSIINTIYFYDEWVDRFDKGKTAKDNFNLTDGNQVECDFMNQTFGSGGFAKGNGFTRSSLSLKNSGRMIFILPDEGISPYELLESPDKIRQAFEDGEDGYGEVLWKIPKFKFGTKLKLVDILKGLNINSAFERDADFSGITDNMAFITEVSQETHIAIDENGVEASAFTQIDYCGSGLPEDRADMILDRPFIYGITADTGTLLFIGVCENPIE